MLAPEIIVVLNMAVSATSPLLVQDTYQQREPDNEYLFHLAANANAVVNVQDNGGLF